MPARRVCCRLACKLDVMSRWSGGLAAASPCRWRHDIHVHASCQGCAQLKGNRQLCVSVARKALCKVVTAVCPHPTMGPEGSHQDRSEPGYPPQGGVHCQRFSQRSPPRAPEHPLAPQLHQQSQPPSLLDLLKSTSVALRTVQSLQTPGNTLSGPCLRHLFERGPGPGARAA
jgi:hypothetical protein